MSGVAWYDVRDIGWVRDVLILLHPPYTVWHLAYVTIGAALAPRLNWGVLGWTVLAFFLAMGIGAHCLDELNGRPLRTRFSDSSLWVTAIVSILLALYIGFTVGVRETIWVIPCIVFGAFIVFAYTLEWFGGKFHYDSSFGYAWGAFPVVTAYVAQTHTISWEAGLVALAAMLYSMAQRKLSHQVRFYRRRVIELQGHYHVRGEGPVVPGVVAWGKRHNLKLEDIIVPAELALKLMTWTIVAAAIGLLLIHI